MWGFPALFHSGVDVAAQPAHPDQDRHGGKALLPWWLHEIAAEEARTGTKLLDVVDVHFYPQGKGIGTGTEGATDEDTAQRRIRSTRALWDPTYVDESWIAQPIQLIPRLSTWIASEHPGLGISIGEYNFGAEGDISGGLAVAEALGRFGELGVTSAFYWDYPPKASPAAWAFRAYRDFDGGGAHFLGESVKVDQTDPRVSLFASRDAVRGHLVLVLLNLDPHEAITVHLDTARCSPPGAHRAFVYTGGPDGFRAADLDPSSPSLPPASITVLDLQSRVAP
jgi:hypothetical protein